MVVAKPNGDPQHDEPSIRIYVEKEREREGEVSSNLTKSDTMIQSVNYTIKHVGSERLEYLSMELVHSTWETQSQWLTRAVAGVQEKVEAKRYSFNSTFPSLPSVMKARKRREDAPKMYEDVIANLIQALLPAEVYRSMIARYSSYVCSGWSWRRRRMSWIQKTNPLVSEDNSPTPREEVDEGDEDETRQSRNTSALVTQ